MAESYENVREAIRGWAIQQQSILKATYPPMLMVIDLYRDDDRCVHVAKLDYEHCADELGWYWLGVTDGDRRVYPTDASVLKKRRSLKHVYNIDRDGHRFIF